MDIFGYSIGHNFHGQSAAGVKIFGVGNSSPVHVDNKKVILVLSEGLTQGIDNTTKQQKLNILTIWQNQEKDLC